MSLASKYKQQLKGRAHALKPVAFIGQHGLTEAVKKEIDNSLTFHELIKVRIQVKDRDLRQEIYNEICQFLNAEKVQFIGNIGVIYRKNAE